MTVAATSAGGSPPDPIEERTLAGAPGRLVLAVSALLLVVAAWAARAGIRAQGVSGSGGRAVAWLAAAVALIAAVTALRGLISVSPGEAVVVQLFGRYLGTIRDPGLRWTRPWAVRRRISIRIRTDQTPIVRVNDADGNPIEIALVAVWRVEDTARAAFAVDDAASFVLTQADIVARQMASSYPYDDHGAGKPCLRASAGEITAMLTAELADRVTAAGVQILDTLITHLRYSPEIAHAMLRRQQAEAVVAARQKIVDGAVAMVESALARLATDGVVDFDEDRKAAMVSNMLVVLCSDQATQPIVNAGTIYQ